MEEVGELVKRKAVKRIPPLTRSATALGEFGWELAEKRRKELGRKPTYFVGFIDVRLKATPNERTLDRIVNVLRRVKGVAGALDFTNFDQLDEEGWWEENMYLCVEAKTAAEAQRVGERAAQAVRKMGLKGFIGCTLKGWEPTPHPYAE